MDTVAAPPHEYLLDRVGLAADALWRSPCPGGGRTAGALCRPDRGVRDRAWSRRPIPRAEALEVLTTIRAMLGPVPVSNKLVTGVKLHDRGRSCR
jgi:hypothetical protein